MNRIEALRERLKRATAGPWEWVGSDLQQKIGYEVVVEAPRESCSTYGCCGGHGTKARDEDRDLIAHSRQDLEDAAELVGVAMAALATMEVEGCHTETTDALRAALSKWTKEAE